MGDLAILHEAQRADRIFDKMADAADALLRVAKAFGLEVNHAAGKTGAIVGIHGPDTRKARQHLAALEAPQEDGSRLPVLPIRPGCNPQDRRCLQGPWQACGSQWSYDQGGQLKVRQCGRRDGSPHSQGACCTKPVC